MMTTSCVARELATWDCAPRRALGLPVLLRHPHYIAIRWQFCDGQRAPIAVAAVCGASYKRGRINCHDYCRGLIAMMVSTMAAGPSNAVRANSARPDSRVSNAADRPAAPAPRKSRKKWISFTTPTISVSQNSNHANSCRSTGAGPIASCSATSHAAETVSVIPSTERAQAAAIASQPRPPRFGQCQKI